MDDDADNEHAHARAAAPQQPTAGWRDPPGERHRRSAAVSAPEPRALVLPLRADSDLGPQQGGNGLGAWLLGAGGLGGKQTHCVAST